MAYKTGCLSDFECAVNICILYVFLANGVAQIFFKKRILDEEGYILSVKKNGLQILIPKYGLEGTIYLNKTGPPNFVFNEEVSIIIHFVITREAVW